MQESLYHLIQELISQGIKDLQTIDAINSVPRENFVPVKEKKYAYKNSALPIDCGQTISQPYIVALMTETVQINKNSRVLEIGTGSGYQTAILATLCKEVYTVEVINYLSKKARLVLDALGYRNIYFLVRNGYQGWPEAAPFDAIIVTAAPPEVPKSLIKQLKYGGKMIIPVGTYEQSLNLITRTKNRVKTEDILPVSFVPLVKYSTVH